MKRILLVLGVALLLALPSSAAWTSGTDVVLTPQQTEKTFTVTWTTSLASSDVDVSACAGGGTAVWDASTGDTSADAGVELKACDAATDSESQCPVVMSFLRGNAGLTVPVNLPKRFLRAKPTAATVGGDTASLVVTCNTPPTLAPGGGVGSFPTTGTATTIVTAVGPFIDGSCAIWNGGDVIAATCPGGGVADGAGTNRDAGDLTIGGTAPNAQTFTIDAGAVNAAKVASDVATQAELDAKTLPSSGIADESVPRADGTTGDLQPSAVLIDDISSITVPGGVISGDYTSNTNVRVYLDSDNNSANSAFKIFNSTDLVNPVFAVDENGVPGGVLGGTWISPTLDDLACTEAKLNSEDFGDFTCGAGADDCLVDALAITTAKIATKSGIGTTVVTTTGTQTAGRCVEINANGDHVPASAACGGGSVTGLKDDADVTTTGTTPKIAGGSCIHTTTVGGLITVDYTGCSSIATITGNTGPALNGPGISFLGINGAAISGASNVLTVDTIGATERTVCHPFPNVSSASAGVNFPFASSRQMTILSFGCSDDTTTTPTTAATMTFQTVAGAAITLASTLTCSGGTAVMPFVATSDADAALVAGGRFEFTVGNTPVPATDTYTVCATVVRSP